MNMNTNSGRGLGNNRTIPGILFSDRVSALLTEDRLSPWDRKVFKELEMELREREFLRSNVDVIKVWLVTVLRASPSCLMVLPCLAMEEWFYFDTSLYCADKSTCSLFDPDLQNN